MNENPHAQSYNTNQILGSWFCGNNVLQIIIIFLVMNINDVFSDLQQGFEGSVRMARYMCIMKEGEEREDE